MGGKCFSCSFESAIVQVVDYLLKYESQLKGLSCIMYYTLI